MIALFSLLLFAKASACDESFVIDSVDYKIPTQWCGKAIDSSLLAKPNQLRQLPQEYTYQDYRIYVLPEVREAFVQMAKAAAKDSIDLIADSGFRSLSFQRRIIRYRLSQGDEMMTILKSVAPPGYSQHHTGRALDLVPSEAKFAFTRAYTWLQENAEKFGFVETLPEDPTGESPWEAWHWYFAGSDSSLQD